jgi:hypothetical protein
MSLSGSQKAYKQARIGIMRIGTSRLNYFTYNPVILINSVDRTTSVNIAALRVSQRLNDEPDTATIVLSPTAGFTPTNGQTVVIALGTSTGIREFAGQIVRVPARPPRATNRRGSTVTASTGRGSTTGDW